MRISATGDLGGIVVGWLIRLVAVLALLGVVAFDGISFAVAQLAVTDAAAAASREASQELDLTGNPQLAYAAALRLAQQESVENEVPTEGFAVGADGSVTVTVVRHPPTLVAHYVPGSEDWLVSEATSSHPKG